MMNGSYLSLVHLESSLVWKLELEEIVMSVVSTIGRQLKDARYISLSLFAFDGHLDGHIIARLYVIYG